MSLSVSSSRAQANLARSIQSESLGKQDLLGNAQEISSGSGSNDNSGNGSADQNKQQGFDSFAQYDSPWTPRAVVSESALVIPKASGSIVDQSRTHDHANNITTTRVVYSDGSVAVTVKEHDQHITRVTRTSASGQTDRTITRVDVAKGMQTVTTVSHNGRQSSSYSPLSAEGVENSGSLISSTSLGGVATINEAVVSNGKMPGVGTEFYRPPDPNLVPELVDTRSFYDQLQNITTTYEIYSDGSRVETIEDHNNGTTRINRTLAGGGVESTTIAPDSASSINLNPMASVAVATVVATDSVTFANTDKNTTDIFVGDPPVSEDWLLARNTLFDEIQVEYQAQLESYQGAESEFLDSYINQPNVLLSRLAIHYEINTSAELIEQYPDILEIAISTDRLEFSGPGLNGRAMMDPAALIFIDMELSNPDVQLMMEQLEESPGIELNESSRSQLYLYGENRFEEIQRYHAVMEVVRSDYLDALHLHGRNPDSEFIEHPTTEEMQSWEASHQAILDEGPGISERALRAQTSLSGPSPHEIISEYRQRLNASTDAQPRGTYHVDDMTNWYIQQDTPSARLFNAFLGSSTYETGADSWVRIGLATHEFAGSGFGLRYGGTDRGQWQHNTGTFVNEELTVIDLTQVPDLHNPEAVFFSPGVGWYTPTQNIVVDTHWIEEAVDIVIIGGVGLYLGGVGAGIGSGIGGVTGAVIGGMFGSGLSAAFAGAYTGNFDWDNVWHASLTGGLTAGLSQIRVLQNPVGRIAIGTGVGGIATELSDGDFEEGAINGFLGSVSTEMLNTMYTDIELSGLSGAEEVVARQSAYLITTAVRVANTEGHPGRTMAQALLNDLVQHVGAPLYELGYTDGVPFGEAMPFGETVDQAIADWVGGNNETRNIEIDILSMQDWDSNESGNKSLIFTDNGIQYNLVEESGFLSLYIEGRDEPVVVLPVGVLLADIGVALPGDIPSWEIRLPSGRSILMGAGRVVGGLARRVLFMTPAGILLSSFVTDNAQVQSMQLNEDSQIRFTTRPGERIGNIEGLVEGEWVVLSVGVSLFEGLTDAQREQFLRPYYGPSGEGVDSNTTLTTPDLSQEPVEFPDGFLIDQNGVLILPGQDLSASELDSVIIMNNDIEETNGLNDSLDSLVSEGRSRSADEVNTEFVDEGYEPPYTPGTTVIEFEADGTVEFARVVSTNEPAGKWVLRAEDIVGLTPEQIADKFALPTIPTGITRLVPPVGTRIRTGDVNENFNRPGGGKQFELLDRVNDGWSDVKPFE